MNQTAVIEVSSENLQAGSAVVCPNPSMQVWNTHPRVFLDLSKTGTAKCPYCGTTYQLKPGAVIGSGH